MTTKPAHITIGGVPICCRHGYLLLSEQSGQPVTCDYTSKAAASLVARALRRCLNYPINSKVRVVDGACPNTRKDPIGANTCPRCGGREK